MPPWRAMAMNDIPMVSSAMLKAKKAGLAFDSPSIAPSRTKKEQTIMIAPNPETTFLFIRWCSWAQRCRLEPFIKTGRTIRKHREGILAAIRLGINNGRIEGLNNRVRLIVRRGFGFHTAQAALALVMLTCGPVELHLPHQRASTHPHP